MVCNYWIKLHIGTRNPDNVWNVSSSCAGYGQHCRELVPHPHPLTIPVYGSHDFQMFCLSRLGLGVGRSEVQGITSPKINSRHMTYGNWWLKPQFLHLSHAELHCFFEFSVVTHLTTHPLLTSGSSVSLCLLPSPTCGSWHHLWHKLFAL